MSVLSIHVPTKGTTESIIVRDHLLGLSIHVPTRARHCCLFCTSLPKVFQSTCPRGHDLTPIRWRISTGSFQSTCPRGHDVGASYDPPIVVLSIHVPTRARQDLSGEVDQIWALSIHVPTRARRPRRWRRLRRIFFQSTCPRGHDRKHPRRLHAADPFNPRAHEGTTTLSSLWADTRSPFNPRAHEGTTGCARACGRAWRFQSTCPRGHDWQRSAENDAENRFQSTCPRGHDIRASRRSWSPRAFQSTCPRGHDCRKHLSAS